MEEVLWNIFPVGNYTAKTGKRSELMQGGMVVTVHFRLKWVSLSQKRLWKQQNNVSVNGILKVATGKENLMTFGYLL